MKGGLAAMIVAFNALCAKPDGLHGTLELHAVGDEEQGGANGTRAVLSKRRKPDACVNGEPTNLQLAVSTKGVVHARLSAVGKSAHGSRPHHGVNAIERLFAALSVLGKQFPTRRVTNANALRTITLNVGTVAGGTARNVVPSQARAELDFRLPAKSYARDRARVLVALRSVCQGGVSFSLIEDEPAWMAPQNSPFVKLARKTLSKLNGRGKPALILNKTGATDARFYGSRGVPTVNVGPGDPFVIHKPNEFVPVKELALAAQFYERLAREFLSGAPGNRAV
jgi:acetylornithine deacetylase/succinyl-diaminopimelate desuccinylase-like protein